MKNNSGEKKEEKPEEFTDKAYFNPKARKCLKLAMIFKASRAFCLLAGFIIAIIGVLIFLQSKAIWAFIVGGIFILVGLILSFFPGRFNRQAINAIKADYEAFYEPYSRFHPIFLQDLKRSFAYVDPATNELYVYQDCHQAFKANLSDIISFGYDLSTVSKKEKEGKWPYYIPYTIKCAHGEEHVVKLTCQYSTPTMYQTDSSKNGLRAMYKYNDGILQSLGQLIKTGGKPVSQPANASDLTSVGGRPVKIDKAAVLAEAGDTNGETRIDLHAVRPDDIYPKNRKPAEDITDTEPHEAFVEKKQEEEPKPGSASIRDKERRE